MDGSIDELVTGESGGYNHGSGKKRFGSTAKGGKRVVFGLLERGMGVSRTPELGTGNRFDKR